MTNLGILTIYFSRNNIFFVLNCAQTNILYFSTSTKKMGFVNLKKDLFISLYQLFSIIKSSKFKFFVLKIKGFNKLRSLLIKQLLKFNLNIIKIIDLNIISFNGCCFSKKRCI